MVKKILRLMVFSVLGLALVGAGTVAFADDGDMEAITCCSSGGPCNAGEACCRKKLPATECSPTQPMQCTANASDCAT